VKKVLKWIGIVLGGLVVLIVLILAGLYISTSIRLNKTYNISVETVKIPNDPAAIARGQRWVSIYCTGCHGDNLAGTVVFEDPKLGYVDASNLTPGKGGIGKEYTDADWVRSIRHGVGPDGKPLLVMPSADFYNLSDQDLGDIIASLKGLPPVDKEMRDPQLTPLGQALVAAGAFGNIIDAERINHNGPRPTPVAPAVTAAYGGYLVKTVGCRTCHGPDLSGGKPPNPQSPPAPNITQSGDLQAWSEADFTNAVRTRKSEFMPWKDLNRMTDDELKAIWLYLKALK
jgi:mono/diheme cytochrome c family protein